MSTGGWECLLARGSEVLGDVLLRRAYRASEHRDGCLAVLKAQQQLDTGGVCKNAQPMPDCVHQARRRLALLLRVICHGRLPASARLVRSEGSSESDRSLLWT